LNKPANLTDPIRIEEEIRRLEFDTGAAQRYAREGKIEAWVQRYLQTGRWANPGLAQGLLLQKRWWNGPVAVNLTHLARVVGPEAGMAYRVDRDYWVERTGTMAKWMTHPLAIPSLIAEYRGGELSVRDGNTRLGAMDLLGWPKCWVIIWYNSESDFQIHSALLFGNGTI